MPKVVSRRYPDISTRFFLSFSSNRSIVAVLKGSILPFRFNALLMSASGTLVDAAVSDSFIVELKLIRFALSQPCKI